MDLSANLPGVEWPQTVGKARKPYVRWCLGAFTGAKGKHHHHDQYEQAGPGGEV